MESTYEITAIRKAVKVLKAFARGGAELSLKQIADLSGLPKSTVHRIVQTLMLDGLVQHNPRSDRFCLTGELVAIALKGLGRRDMVDAAAPLMRELAEVTGETVSLNVAAGLERVCIYRVEGSRPITRTVALGEQGPLYCGAAGKILLAGLSDAEVQKVIDRGLEPQCKNTITDPERLWEEVRRIRERGYATSVEERFANSASVGAPVRDCSGQTIAALTVAMPADRFTKEVVEDLIGRVKAQAAAISYRLGWVPEDENLQ
ncbi:MAG: IclR family transcriptional regulator [Moorellales bacterium]